MPIEVSSKDVPSMDYTQESKPQFDYDLCIVGTGRVGLPLGLSFTEAGSRAIGIDLNSSVRESVNAGRMPFDEPGYEALAASKQFKVYAESSVVSRAKAVIITVGTPLHQHIETDLTQVERVLEQLQPHLRVGQLLALRSTVAPGTTTFVRRWIEQHTDFRVGETLYLAFCPERIAEGKAYEEIHSLPQIVGTEDPESLQRAEELFLPLSPEILHTDYVTAELVKLFNNILRYVHFALANQFAIVANDFGANIFEARRLANYKYPRSFLAAPGFTAGTCLRKDFGMINEWSSSPDLLLSAWKVNEYMPAYLVSEAAKVTTLHGARIAMLGFAFKADTDDIRDSLAPKLWRYIHRQMPAEIRVSDHHLPNPIPEPTIRDLTNYSAYDAVTGASVIFVATNHSGYSSVLRRVAERSPETWVVDLWNVGQVDQVIYRAGDLLMGVDR